MGSIDMLILSKHQATARVFNWLAESWSLILAEPSQTHPAEPTRPNPPRRHHIFWAELSRYLSWKLAEEIENFRTSVTDHNDPLLIMINIPNPSQEPPATSKSPSEDIKDIDVLCTFKIKIEGKNLENGRIRDKFSYSNQGEEAILVRKLQHPT